MKAIRLVLFYTFFLSAGQLIAEGKEIYVKDEGTGCPGTFQIFRGPTSSIGTFAFATAERVASVRTIGDPKITYIGKMEEGDVFTYTLSCSIIDYYNNWTWNVFKNIPSSKVLITIKPTWLGYEFTISDYENKSKQVINEYFIMALLKTIGDLDKIH